MIQTKQLYEAPEAQALVVRFEGVICGSLDGKNKTETLITSPFEEL